MTTPDIKSLALAAVDRGGEWYKEDGLRTPINQPDRAFVAAATPERILQYRDEVLEEAIQVVENWHFDRRPGNLRKLHETLCSLKSKEPSP